MMNKLFTQIALGVIIVTGMLLLVFDQITAGLCLSIPALLLLLIVTVFEPSSSKKILTKDAQSKEVAGAPVLPDPVAERKLVAEATEPSASPEKQQPAKAAIPVGQDEKTEMAPGAPLPAEASLRKEIAELTELVERKTKESESLSAKLKDRRDIKLLQRVAQFQIALEFNRKMMAAGKMDEAKALREVELELETALDELGIKPYPIEAGVKLRELPNGSFELLKAEAPESPELAGTVKAVHQSAMTYKDADGHTHFLIPAKIDAHKLS